MSRKSGTNLQARDDQILTDLALTPLDAQQLLQLGRRYTPIFTGEKAVRNRLLKLEDLGLVKHFYYQTSTNGARKYYKLSKEGYRYVHGPRKALPSRSFFAVISPALQRHTRCLSQFFVHAITTAHSSQMQLQQIYGENEFVLKIGEREQRLDAAAQFTNRGKTYNCLFEMDCGTEPVFSRKQRESLAQKIQFIYDFQRVSKHAFRHYMLFATPSPRMHHYLNVVQELNPDPRRHLCFAVLLEQFLKTPDPFRSPIWLDHDAQLASVVAGNRSREQQRLPSFAEAMDKQLMVG